MLLSSGGASLHYNKLKEVLITFSTLLWQQSRIEDLSIRGGERLSVECLLLFIEFPLMAVLAAAVQPCCGGLGLVWVGLWDITELP